LFAVLTPLSLLAGGPSRPISLDEALEIAFQNEPSLFAAQSTALAAKERTEIAGAGYLPTLNFDAIYLPQSGNFVPRPGMNFQQFAADPSMTPYHYFNFTLSLRETLYDFGRTSAGVEQSRHSARAAKTDVERARLDLWAAVVSRYIAVLSSQEMLGVAKRSRDQAVRYATRARAMYDAGLRPMIDVVRTEADAQTAEAALLSAQDALALSQAALAALFGRHERFDFSVAPLPDSFADESIPSVEDALAEAQARRPELAALAHRISAQEALVRRQRAGYYPTLFAQAGFTLGGTAIDALVYNWSLGIGLSLPLFSGFSTSHEQSEAEATLAALRANLDSLRLNIRMEVEQALRRLADDHARLGPVSAALQAAREALRLADGRYEAGTGNQVELLDAQASLANAEAALVRARFEVALSWVALQRVLGRLPERWQKK
jgi:outer membrane protein